MADLENYEQSELCKEIMDPLQPFFVGEYKTYRCEVKHTDMVDEIARRAPPSFTS
jgi:hypothetical protein